jgi:hypothetical protein
LIIFRNFFNLYVGWGQKYEQFNPSQPPPPEREYTQEFIEKNDPTVEMEKLIEDAQRAAAAATTDEDFTSEEENYEEPMTDEEEDQTLL